MIRRVIVAALLLATLGCGQPVAAQPERQTATVTRVTDGDSVHIQRANGTRETVRLIGIDTPETVDPRKPVQCFGREASAHAHALLDGQTVTVELDPSQGDRDRYGRTLAYLYLSDGTNVAEQMIHDGYGHEYTYRRPYLYRDQFRAAEKAAQKSGAGLWATTTCSGKP